MGVACVIGCWLRAWLVSNWLMVVCLVDVRLLGGSLVGGCVVVDASLVVG